MELSRKRIKLLNVKEIIEHEEIIIQRVFQSRMGSGIIVGVVGHFRCIGHVPTPVESLEMDSDIRMIHCARRPGDLQYIYGAKENNHFFLVKLFPNVGNSTTFGCVHGIFEDTSKDIVERLVRSVGQPASWEALLFQPLFVLVVIQVP